MSTTAPGCMAWHGTEPFGADGTCLTASIAPEVRSTAHANGQRCSMRHEPWRRSASARDRCLKRSGRFSAEGAGRVGVIPNPRWTLPKLPLPSSPPLVHAGTSLSASPTFPLQKPDASIRSHLLPESKVSASDKARPRRHLTHVALQATHKSVGYLVARPSLVGFIHTLLPRAPMHARSIETLDIPCAPPFIL